jgi:hypothetical protein
LERSRAKMAPTERRRFGGPFCATCFCAKPASGSSKCCLVGKPAESCKRSFDETTPPINGEIAWDIGFAIFLGRDHGEGAVIVELLAQPIVGKAYVANQRGDPDPFDQRRHADAAIPLSRQQHETVQVAERIDSATILVVRPSRAPSAGSG